MASFLVHHQDGAVSRVQASSPSEARDAAKGRGGIARVKLDRSGHAKGRRLRLKDHKETSR